MAQYNLKWKWLLDPFGKVYEFNLQKGMKYRFTLLLGEDSKMRAVNPDGEQLFSLVNMGQGWTHGKYDFTYDEDYKDGFAVQFIGQVQNLTVDLLGVDYDLFK